MVNDTTSEELLTECDALNFTNSNSQAKDIVFELMKNMDFELDLDHLQNGDFEFEVGVVYGA